MAGVDNDEGFYVWDEALHVARRPTPDEHKGVLCILATIYAAGEHRITPNADGSYSHTFTPPERARYMTIKRGDEEEEEL